MSAETDLLAKEASTQAPQAAKPTNEAPASTEQLAPGVTVEVRDEHWLVTGVARTNDGFRVRVRGLSDYVRDTTATFFTALDRIEVLDPTKVEVVPDNSPRYRHARLWVESTLRQTAVPLHQQELEVSTRMLADPLDYQLAAVHKALSPDNVRPRILLADAVGLGKTLEIGMILAELIRRGRGERILVVTPKHVMEQFQQELWTRFAIPLVRLDSVGIQKVRQKLPASRNPFTYFPRVIVSMDTLKSPKYRAQLNKVRWDAVVIDEIHNATNVGTQNNELARTLAPTTDAMILASATPHNGDDNSFKEILRLLDPLSVLQDGSIDTDAAKRLIIRRHRNSPEVASVVGDKWAVREEPNNIPVDASPEENAIARELHSEWVNNPKADRLFPWTLVKAYLSSPAALGETVASRSKRIPDNDPEQIKLTRLAELNDKVTPDTSAKYNALIQYLQSIGIKKGSPTRVVIFSERVATLHWLQTNVSKDLKLPKGAVKIMHGGLSDTEQMELIDEFKREDTPLRVLITGDVASEGVNLHAQCHHLVHYDIPWSLIRIQQRNGRIDRYGQTESPRITTLLLDPAEANSIGELHVLTKLVDREYSAHKILGDAAPLMGKHSIRGEEDAIREVLQGVRDFEQTVAEPDDIATGAHALVTESTDAEVEGTTFDITALLAGLAQAEDNTTGISIAAEFDKYPDTTYPSELDYLRDAVSEAFEDPHRSPTNGGINWVEHDNDIVELTPPDDLKRRFDFLPQDYVSYRHIKDNLKLATTTQRGNQQLKAAREGSSEKSWPDAHYLGPLHPVSDWAADRALSKMTRREIPAVTGNVDTPTVFLLGTLTNEHGQVISRSFVAASEGPLGPQGPALADPIEDPVSWLAQAGLTQDAISDGSLKLPDSLPDLMSSAVTAAQNHMSIVYSTSATAAESRTAEWAEREASWAGSSAARRETDQRTVEQERSLLNSMMPRRSLVRPLLVILPTA
ncbi:DEAD/DEAH box helicase [Corynebacterium lubricantis]|uniref:DEAD/DEAH box helicase n=1 Tax=Corynebacterium lubricantis TaxID=541095 RepID=UPI00037BA820|nr:DEAD/DEAH box helicase [Corynebacterium lubricantis]